LWDGAIVPILLITRVVGEVLRNSSEGWGVSSATSRSILMLIRITILIRELLTEFPLLRYKNSRFLVMVRISTEVECFIA